MAKITVVRTDCRDQIAPNCERVFERPVQRGRPQVNCDKCKAFKAPASSGEITKTCVCKNTFTVVAGRGRKQSKCDDCRKAGIVYRSNDDGEIETIRKETLDREQRELREQRGRETADRLVMLMAPLLKKTNRKVIVH